MGGGEIWVRTLKPCVFIITYTTLYVCHIRCEYNVGNIFRENFPLEVTINELLFIAGWWWVL